MTGAACRRRTDASTHGGVSLPAAVACLLAAACGGSTQGAGPADGGAPVEAGAQPETGISTGNGGRTVVTYSLQGPSYVLRLDATNAYVIAGDPSGSGDGQVFRLALADGQATALAPTTSYAIGMALTPTTVYWSDQYGSTANPDGGLFAVPIAGGATSGVVSGLGIVDLAADETNLYWVTSGQGQGQCQASTPCTGAVMTMPLAGGTPATVVSGLSGPASIALDATSVYWGTNDGHLMKAPKSGGTPTTLAFYQTSAPRPVVDATGVYWSAGAGDVMKTPLDGGPSTAIYVGLDQVSAIALDSDSVYWATYSYSYSYTGASSGQGAIKKVARSGGTPTTVWSGTEQPVTVQVDSTSVYFTTYAYPTGALVKVTPK